MPLRWLTCLGCEWTIADQSHRPIAKCDRCGSKEWRVLLEAEVDALFHSQRPWRLSRYDLVLLRQLRIAADVPEVG